MKLNINKWSHLLACIIISACSNNKQAEEKVNKVEKETRCIELPNFIVNKRQINDNAIVIECYLDDNSIHQFNDGPGHPVKIVPIIKNETTNEELFVDKKTLIGYDTIDSPVITKFQYSIMFPSPKGGNVRIYKALK